jgi:hypothetical protein
MVYFDDDIKVPYITISKVEQDEKYEEVTEEIAI